MFILLSFCTLRFEFLLFHSLKFRKRLCLVSSLPSPSNILFRKIKTEFSQVISNHLRVSWHYFWGDFTSKYHSTSVSKIWLSIRDCLKCRQMIWTLWKNGWSSDSSFWTLNSWKRIIWSKIMVHDNQLEKSNKLLRIRSVHGRNISVVREVYRRENVPCQSPLCLSDCQNSTGKYSCLPGW